jgi:hypothetical protein
MDFPRQLAHRFCLQDPVLIWGHLGADALIALSYFLIPSAIAVFLVKFTRFYQQSQEQADGISLIDWLSAVMVKYKRLGVEFSLFIAMCGIGHVMNIVVLYVPVYWAQLLIDLATGLVSFVTAIDLFVLKFVADASSELDVSSQA